MHHISFRYLLRNAIFFNLHLYTGLHVGNMLLLYVSSFVKVSRSYILKQDRMSLLALQL